MDILNTLRRKAFVLIGLGILLLLWQLAFWRGGVFVMPAPVDAFARAFDLLRKGLVLKPAAITAGHVLTGYIIGSGVGLACGLLGGSFRDLGSVFETISAIVLGIPPIIWIVLALLWFGPQGYTASFTVAIGIGPVVFAGALAGMRSAHADYDELAQIFRAPWRQKLWEIRAPQISIVLVPALATALGFSWKMALMAEILDAGSGIGGQIAEARAHLDTIDTMAWVLIALALLLACDTVLAALTRGRLFPPIAP